MLHVQNIKHLESGIEADHSLQSPQRTCIFINLIQKANMFFFVEGSTVPADL